MRTSRGWANAQTASGIDIFVSTAIAEQQTARSKSDPSSEQMHLSPVGRPGEGIEERIQREKKERWEASDEYKEIMKKKASEAHNVKVASEAQVSEEEVLGGKRDNQLEAGASAKVWIEAVLKTNLEGEMIEGVVVEALNSGEILCDLANSIRPGVVRHKISKSRMPFPRRENINAFIDAARTLGVPDAENFQTDDLFESRA